MQARNSGIALSPAIDSSPSLELVAVASGAWTLRSRSLGETFHPVVGPRAEAEALHVRQQRLLERAQRVGKQFVIWDVGLGAAANAVVSLEALRPLEPGCSVTLHSFDLHTDTLRFALQHQAELAYFGDYVDACEELLRQGEVRVGPIHWQLHLGDFGESLDRREIPSPHAILYDPYSPVSNPSMWSLAHFTRLHRRLDPGDECTLTSYSRSTSVRVTLLLAGFFVGRGQAIAEKEETTMAATSLGILEQPLDAKWLERVRRSTRSAPLPHTAGERRLSAEDWDRLTRHPQFT